MNELEFNTSADDKFKDDPVLAKAKLEHMKSSDFGFSMLDQLFGAQELMNVWECVLGLECIPTEWGINMKY